MCVKPGKQASLNLKESYYIFLIIDIAGNYPDSLHQASNPRRKETHKIIDVPFYDNNYLLIFTLACKVSNKFEY